MPAGQDDSAAAGLEGKLEFMHIIERLKTQTRTGWVNVKVPGRVESIADHMYRMAMLSLLSEEDEDLDIAKCVQLAVVHDLAEALVGDITPHDGISKADKQKLEEDAMHTLTQKKLDPNGPASKRIRALFEEYEQRSTKEARFVKDLDLLEMALQGSEYEADRGSDQIQPFFESSIPKIQHPEVMKWGHELMQQRHARFAGNPTYEHVDVNLPQPEGIRSTLSPVQTPNPLVQLAPSSTRVTDADDEIFDLYTRLSSPTTEQPQEQLQQFSNSRIPSANKPSEVPGLGFVDAKKNTLHISIEIAKPSLPTSATSRNRTRAKRRSSSSYAGPSSPPSTKTSAKVKPQKLDHDTVDVEIQQDLNGLHARTGDTGSIVWRASVLLATLILQQISCNQHDLFEPELLAKAEVLEMGGGTGVLSTLLAPCVKSWTVTDMAELLPLIHKNHQKNKARLSSASNVQLAELDWTWSFAQFQKNAKGISQQHYDLVFAVDCLYNEALVQPFVDTINRLNCRYIVVVSELRSAEVLRLFLELWLSSGSWTIYRPCFEGLAGAHDGNGDIESAGLLGRRHVVWIGWIA